MSKIFNCLPRFDTHRFIRIGQALDNFKHFTLTLQNPKTSVSSLVTQKLFVINGNAENAIIYHNRGTIYATTGSAICISSGAKNTNATIIGDYNYDCAGGFEDKGSNTTTGYIIFFKIDPPSREPDWYT